jgi:hypothetical protein
MRARKSAACPPSGSARAFPVTAKVSVPVLFVRVRVTITQQASCAPAAATSALSAEVLWNSCGLRMASIEANRLSRRHRRVVRRRRPK